MSDRYLNTVKNTFSVLFSSSLFILSVLPGFNLIGNLLAQVAITVILNVIILLLLDFVIKIKPVYVSYSLQIMTVFWVLSALIKQINIHINTSDYSFKWLYLFYYDKPALVFLVMFVAVLYYVIKLLKKKRDLDYINSYKIFSQNVIWCLLVYYALILFYCFYLVREITFEHTEPNLIPFAVINFSIRKIDYELLFLLLGNVAIFFPLGVLVSSLTNNRIINFFLPFVVSVGIEISQFILGNGHPDIDDVILNVLGYYFGFLIRMVLDRIVYIASDKQIKSFIIFEE